MEQLPSQIRNEAFLPGGHSANAGIPMPPSAIDKGWAVPMAEMTRDITLAWRELFSTLRTLPWQVGAVFFIAVLAVAAEAVAGLLELRESISPETASWFRVSKDWSIFEILGYLELLVAAAFLFLTAQILRSRLHYYFCALTAYLVLDDALQFHEHAGELIGNKYFDTPYFNTMASLRPQDLGELTYFAMVILVASAFLVWSSVASTRLQRLQCTFLLLPMAFIALSSTGLDLLHALVPKDNRLLGGAVAIVEDGSEILGFGLLLLVAMAQWKLARRTTK